MRRHLGIIVGVLPLTLAGWAFFTFLLPWSLGFDSWANFGDAWAVVQPATYVSTGAFPYLYSPYFLSPGAWPYPPGLPALFAPVIAVADRFDLVMGAPLATPRNPSGWLLLGPALAVTATAVAPAALALAARLGLVAQVRRRWALAASVTALGAVPAGIQYGHGEDVVAMAALLAAVAATLDGRWRRAAVAVGVALLFKQWAFVLLPFLAARAPAGQRARWLAWAAAIPGVPILVCVAFDPAATMAALTGALASPSKGQRMPWVDVGGYLAATPLRVVSLVVLATVGVGVRRIVEPRAVVALAGALMLGRLLFEPTLFAYYQLQWVPFALILAASAPRPRLLLPTTAGLAFLFWFSVHPGPVWWPMAIALAWPLVEPIVQSLRGRRSPAIERPVPAAASPV